MPGKILQWRIVFRMAVAIVLILNDCVFINDFVDFFNVVNTMAGMQQLRNIWRQKYKGVIDDDAPYQFVNQNVIQQNLPGITNKNFRKHGEP